MRKALCNKSLTIRNAIVWASTMIAIAIILSKTDINSSLSGSIMMTQIAGWFVSDQALRRARS